MKLLFVILAVLITNQYAHSAACPLSSASGVSAGNGTCDVTDGTTGTTIQLNFNSGFDSTTLIENDNAAALATDTYLNTDFAATVVANSATASIASGNNGATVGAQRKLSFIKAAEIIASQLVSAETIIVDADFTALSCSSGGGTLGSAGAAANLGNVSVNKSGANNPPAGQIANTFYPIALLNAMGSDDYDAGSDVNANYNLNIGTANCIVSSNGWYYGFDAPVAVHYDQDVNGNPISWGGGADIIIDYTAFTTVLLHEMLHGFGFASLTNASTGAKASGIDDIFSNFLFSEADSDLWTVAAALTNGERAASAISDTGLLWAGTNVNTQAVGVLTDGFNNSGTGSSVLFEADDKVEMYAPNPVESGSSVSHFNTAASPNEIMEPQYTEYLESLGLALYLLQDIGWSITPPAANNAPTITAVDQSTNEDTDKVVDISSWGADADGDTKTYSVSSCAANITCSISGINLTLSPAANHNGATHAIEIQVSDGNGGTATDTFNLTVTAQNDAPEWSAISTQNVTVSGSSVDVDLASYASDAEGDTLSYSEVSCGTGLTCSLSGSTLTLSANSNAGATVTVEMQADDGNSGQTNVTFSVSISAAGNAAPSWTTIPDQDLIVGDTATINLNSYASDGNGDSMTYSGCGATAICSISSNVLTINTGSVDNEDIVITADDGNGGSTASASFNIDIVAANTAPVITNPGNQAVELGQTLSFALSASDAEGDSLSYSVNANAAAGASIVSTSSVSFTPNASGEYSITVTASDASLSDDATFTLSVYDTPTVDFDSTTLQPNNGSENAISSNDFELDISNVADIFDFDLDFDGSDVSSTLMVINGTSLSIAMPTSGQFAGTYTLTATDSISGNEYEYTFVRSPRLILSATKILSNTAVQTLTIEGGAASTVYTLTSSESALSFSINNAEVTTASASDDGANFNPATLTLTAGTVVSSTTTALDVTSIYETVSTSGLSIEPARTHTITIEDNDGVAINQAQLSLDVSNLSTFNLVEDYASNSAGELTITLPDDGNDYDVVASHTGLGSVTTTLVSSVLEQTITLSPPINPLDLTGIIKAGSSVSFSSELPVVTLSLIDNSTVNIPVTATSDSQVEFDYTHDLNNGDVNSIKFSHSGAVDVTINLLTRGVFDFDVTMDARSTTTVIVASSSGGGSIFWLLLLLLMANRFNRKPFKSL